MKTDGERRISTRSGAGLVGVVAAALFVSTLTLCSTAASALDINGLINTAIALNYAHYHIRAPSANSGSHAAAKRDRDGDDADDEASDDHNRKSVGTPSQHRPASKAPKTMDVSSGDPADTMVSLGRSHDGRAGL
jgi:hypothetical protein